jgi:site-specific DNA-methyltransferase (adenine-specific)
LKTYHKNPRQITERQFKDLEKWLEELGDLGGIVHDLNSDEVIGGNQRARVFDILKAESAPIVLTDEFDPPTKQGTVALGYIQWRGEQYGYRQVRWTARQCEQANVVANRAGGGWDWDVLANEFKMGDLLEWGFTEFDFQMAGVALPEDEPPDDPGPQIDKAAELQKKWGTALGQVWELGEHRMVCGDCTDKAVVEAVMRGEGIDALITDPPYSSGGQFRSDRSQSTREKYVQSGTRVTRRNFSGDNKDQRAFLSWASYWLGDAFANSNNGAITIIFVDWRQLPLMTDAVQWGGWVWRNIITWWKPGIRMQRGRFSLSAEYLIYASRGVPVEGEQSPQNVLSFPPVDQKDHIAEKPVDLLCILIGVTLTGAVIYDPFLGSGTTLIACERLGRKCRGIEIEPKYIAVTLERWHQMTGVEPVLVSG